MPDLKVDMLPMNEVADGIIIEPKGFIDTTTAPEIEKYIESALNQKKYKIAIDLKSVDFISSAGWGVFVSEIRDIRDNNGDLVLVNMVPDVYDVYELMEFSSILRSFDSVEEAVSYFKGE
ncbi:MAG: STAS domain-containing protein [Spirochaetes bacterium]|nr:STAS domain-containing protein [Spirochaetota bacterium]